MSCTSDTLEPDEGKSQNARALKDALVSEFPEIERLCSDSYLNAVIGVPERAFEYARDEKIKKALEWRRSFGVDCLCSRFRYDAQRGVLNLLPATEVTHPELFEPSEALLKLCKTQSFRINPDCDSDGRVVLFAETQLLDWHASGVEAGLQYHVLVIETALDWIRAAGGKMPESLILLVDTSGPMLAIPPPLAAVQGLASLLQRAYPDRMHRICVGPLNFVIRGLYQAASRFLSKNSVNKIHLVGTTPSLEILDEEAQAGIANIPVDDEFFDANDSNDSLEAIEQFLDASAGPSSNSRSEAAAHSQDRSSSKDSCH